MKSRAGTRIQTKVLLALLGLVLLGGAGVVWLPEATFVVSDPQPAPKGRLLFGRVVDEDGQPIAGAGMYVGGAKVSVTDERGYFRDAVSTSSRNRIAWVTAPGRERRNQRGLPSGKIRLRPGGVVRGRVVTTAGEPLAGAEVYFAEAEQYPGPMEAPFGFRSYGVDRRYSVQKTTSDADGAFILEGCPAVEGYVVTHAPDRVALWEPVRPQAGEEVESLLALPPDPVLETARVVRVLRPDGTEHDAARVIYTNEYGSLNEARGASPLDLSRRYGRIATLEVRDGNERFAPVYLEELPAGDDPLRVELVPGEPLEIVVTDPLGNPIGNAQVDFSWPTFSSSGVWHRFGVGESGRRSLREPEATFRVSAVAPGFKAREFGRFEPGDAEGTLTLRLEPSGALRGCVVDEDGPVEGALVSVELLRHETQYFEAGGLVDDTFVADLQTSRREIRTDAEGVFQAPMFDDGRVSVGVEVAGRPVQAFGPFEVSKDPPVREITLQLEALGGLEGRVLTGDDRPLGGITVMACPGWNAVFRTTTDGDGAYRFEGLPPGRYQVRRARDAGGVPKVRDHLTAGSMHARAENPRPWDCEVLPGAVTAYDPDLSGEVRLTLDLKPAEGQVRGASARVVSRALFDEHGGNAPPIAMLELADGKSELQLSRGGRYVLDYRFSTRFGGKHVYQTLTTPVELGPGAQAFSWRPEYGVVVLRPPGGPADKDPTYRLVFRSELDAGTFEARLSMRRSALDAASDRLRLPVGAYEVSSQVFGTERQPSRIEVRAEGVALVQLP